MKHRVKSERITNLFLDLIGRTRECTYVEEWNYVDFY
jgi:hypothetical protein